MGFFEGNFGVVQLVWWFLWLIVIVWMVSNRHKMPLFKSKKEEPLYILKKRYANGEISKEEYEESKKALEQDK